MQYAEILTVRYHERCRNGGLRSCPCEVQTCVHRLSPTPRVLFGLTRLQPFLLSQLERAADHTARASTGPLLGRTGEAARAEMHPVLYPILLLLARLRVAGGHAESGPWEVRETMPCDRWHCRFGCWEISVELLSATFHVVFLYLLTLFSA